MCTEPFKKNRRCISAGPAGALYVHVPFCRAKCRYCDFFSQLLDEKLAESFVRAAIAELAANANQLAGPLRSVFFGGGTPTALGGQLLGELLKSVQPYIDANTEFSVEANPATCDSAMAELLARSGVNRVNLGVQSFQESQLQLLGRIHTADQAHSAVSTLQAAGFENIGLDLIYGIPGQTLESWRDSLDQALSLGIEHLSCYGLSFEAGTPMGADLQAGRVSEVDEEIQRACYYTAIEAAGDSGFEHYEISNFARPGRRCLQNLAYWHNEPYLGIGPAAASYIRGVRRTNQPSLSAYIEAISAGAAPPSADEHLTGRNAMAEAIMLGLRLIDGLDRSVFAGRFGQDPVDAFAEIFDRYEQLGAVVITPEYVRISEDFLFVADAILAEIISAT